jgi:hypothetical protein
MHAVMDPDRYVYLAFQIDTNRINARRRLPQMNRLEKWKADGVILMEMSEPAQAEAAAGGSPARTRKAYSHIYSMTRVSTPEEQTTLRKIEDIIFPEVREAPNERNDVEIVFNTIKYGRILLTGDGGSRRQPGGILGNRDQLQRLGVQVMTDAEAVALVEQRILERDQCLRESSQRRGASLSEWVGRD